MRGLGLEGFLVCVRVGARDMLGDISVCDCFFLWVCLGGFGEGLYCYVRF